MRKLRVALLAGLTATAVEAGLSYGHALQEPGKRELPAERLMHFHTRVLGPYRVGAGVPEVSAMAALALASWFARREPGRRLPGALALAADVAAFGVWARGIQPVNRRLSTWDGSVAEQRVPDDWVALRDRWHALHKLRLALLSTGTAAAAAALAAE
ncbi:anthrone oxygenase family protein [Blastococcus sp. SYSU DS0510]